MNQLKDICRIRMPSELKKLLEIEAKQAHRSVNGQILHYIDQARKLEKKEINEISTTSLEK